VAQLHRNIKPENEKILNLENIQFKELRRIKEKFEEIKWNTEKPKDI